jgi:hypothetical protein
MAASECRGTRQLSSLETSLSGLPCGFSRTRLAHFTATLKRFDTHSLPVRRLSVRRQLVSLASIIWLICGLIPAFGGGEIVLANRSLQAQGISHAQLTMEFIPTEPVKLQVGPFTTGSGEETLVGYDAPSGTGLRGSDQVWSSGFQQPNGYAHQPLSRKASWCARVISAMLVN